MILPVFSVLTSSGGCSATFSVVSDGVEFGFFDFQSDYITFNISSHLRLLR